MANVFSGSWQAENQPLITKLSQLARIAQSEFDIEISIEKMLKETEYRQLVISELNQLAHQDISQITLWLTSRNEYPLDMTENNIVTSAKSSVVLNITLTLLLTLIVATSFFWYSNTYAPTKSLEQTRYSSAILIKKSNDIIESNEYESSATELKPIVEPEVETVFRLHGSNTIGEKLAPLLLEGFLKKRGVDTFSWTRSTALERVLNIVLILSIMPSN